ncbi:NADH-quinone oxidoreductase subunit NuoK [Candidatus Sumerlaeota bacterium]|nr:NADH-quinone oxidoreductase subunit NuoK [Candidatus Sumerlaeota bacterium]MBI3735914.1 NADH-quinone oxidoreductase subunit NuoK [Candidatus Sumerlaeota bacterium]
MVAAILFCLGLIACIARRNAIGILIGIELILNAANLNFLAFWRFSGAAAGTGGYDGPIFAIFVIILAACEAAVALGIVINLFYNFGTVEVDTINKMKN